MKVDVVLTAGAIVPEELAGRTAVVFDVLRATSTIVTALANGCRAVVPVADVDEARRVAGRIMQTEQNTGGGNTSFVQGAVHARTGEKAKLVMPPDSLTDTTSDAATDDISGMESHSVLLAGERGGARLPGFPHGNSPLEYGPAVIAGKILVLTTTNGTRAIHGAAPAAAVCAGSLLNARAAAAAALAAGRDVSLVCAGTQERFSLEDTAAAGFVLMEMLALAGSAGRWELSDPAVAALHLARAYRQNPLQIMYDSRHGQKLLGMGQAPDLAWCARVNALDAVPVYREGRLVLKEPGMAPGSAQHRRES